MATFATSSYTAPYAGFNVEALDTSTYNAVSTEEDDTAILNAGVLAGSLQPFLGTSMGLPSSNDIYTFLEQQQIQQLQHPGHQQDYLPRQQQQQHHHHHQHHCHQQQHQQQPQQQRHRRAQFLGENAGASLHSHGSKSLSRIPARPALSASSGSAASATSSMMGSPVPSETFVLQHGFGSIPMASDNIGAFEDISVGHDLDLQATSNFLSSHMPYSYIAEGAQAQRTPLTPVGNPVPHYIPRQHTYPASPALSSGSSHGPSRLGPSYSKTSRASSPLRSQVKSWAPYPQAGDSRRPSSISYGHSSPGSGTNEVEEMDKEKNRCPFPDCGRIFKDLKAHILTHQNERPEKCPIPSCEYNKKGFSRKYDKNRHTLTHYKGTMVCGFCPGSGSAAEKSFNRADVFKRHLMAVHGVEQNPPNSRKKVALPDGKASNAANDATGKCSICNGIFSTPQNFYEHLEDCVLSVVQNIEPSEAINEQLLTSMAEDDGVKDTMGRHNLPIVLDASMHPQQIYTVDDEEDERDSDECEDGSAPQAATAADGKPDAGL